jgi:hypothetical protein
MISISHNNELFRVGDSEKEEEKAALCGDVTILKKKIFLRKKNLFSPDLRDQMFAAICSLLEIKIGENAKYFKRCFKLLTVYITYITSACHYGII